MKTKGKTPKYGLIFNSTFIGRANQKNKGRISRYLANKCAIASRVDCFSEAPTAKFGEVLKDQMEERLNFLSKGTKPRKNKDVMNEVIAELKTEGLFYGDKVKVAAGQGDKAADSDDDEPVKEKKRDKKEKSKKKAESSDDESEVPEKKKKDKKEKKDKKRKHADSDDEDSEVAKPEKKKKKSKD